MPGTFAIKEKPDQTEISKSIDNFSKLFTLDKLKETFYQNGQINPEAISKVNAAWVYLFTQVQKYGTEDEKKRAAEIDKRIPELAKQLNLDSKEYTPPEEYSKKSPREALDVVTKEFKVSVESIKDLSAYFNVESVIQELESKAGTPAVQQSKQQETPGEQQKELTGAKREAEKGGAKEKVPDKKEGKKGNLIPSFLGIGMIALGVTSLFLSATAVGTVLFAPYLITGAVITVAGIGTYVAGLFFKLHQPSLKHKENNQESPVASAGQSTGQNTQNK